jgi:flagellar biosynthesis/type III secretory pathway chaperone
MMNRHSPPPPPQRKQPLSDRAIQRMGVAPPPRLLDNYGEGVVLPTVGELRDLVIQLKDVLEQETAQLERFDYDSLERTSEQKRVIGGLLREKQKVLNQHPQALLDTPEPERKDLERLLAEMQKVGRRNEIVVRTARDANRKLLDAVIRGATKQSQLGTGYGRSGAMTALTTNYAARQPVSLFNNETC